MSAKPRLKPLSEQTIVVTGATSGLGLSVARRAAAAGARVFLIARGIISRHAPVAMLAGVALPALLMSLIAPDHYAGPLLHLLSGGVMLAAFFIVTDPVTSPNTATARPRKRSTTPATGTASPISSNSAACPSWPPSRVR